MCIVVARECNHIVVCACCFTLILNFRALLCQPLYTFALWSFPSLSRPFVCLIGGWDSLSPPGSHPRVWNLLADRGPTCREALFFFLSFFRVGLSLPPPPFVASIKSCRIKVGVGYILLWVERTTDWFFSRRSEFPHIDKYLSRDIYIHQTFIRCRL